ncbi:hypothetical protein HHI36_022728 [Cryptolaemus montrouzieri]|uniref:DDE Tnp4 domain-containing protein n=1 Tax=Cryptolaemus montrouzieri TaxID=559131 RepID=A0ABD2N1P2_9CUCU
MYSYSILILLIHLIYEIDVVSATQKTKHKRLKKCVVPSQKLPVMGHSEKHDRNSKKKRRKNSLNTLEEEESLENELEIKEEVDQDESMHFEGYLESSTIPNFSRFRVERDPLLPDPSSTYSQERAVQTDSAILLSEMLDTDEKLMTFTGVDSKIFKRYEECMRNVKNEDPYDFTNVRSKLILVMTKLKLNMPFAALAILMGVSSTTCAQYFYDTLKLLALALKQEINWKSREEILINRETYPGEYRNICVVLKSTEVTFQKIKCLKCTESSCSHHKGINIVRFMLGIAPSGFIYYLSSGYESSFSDKGILKKESFLHKLASGDTIVADNALMIDEECENASINLIKLPLRKIHGITKSDEETLTSIEKACAHVKKTLERIKMFNIIDHKVDWYLLPSIDKIMTVIAATVNLTSVLPVGEFLSSNGNIRKREEMRTKDTKCFVINM